MKRFFAAHEGRRYTFSTGCWDLAADRRFRRRV